MATFDRHDESSLTPEAALEQFRHYGFLWVRLNSSVHDEPQNVMNNLRNEYSLDKEAYQRNWSVENLGACSTEKDLGADVFFGKEQDNRIKSCCVSTIIHRKDSTALNSLMTQVLPFEQHRPPLLGESCHNGGAWLFMGRNVPEEDSAAATGKRKRDESILAGRAEHVDEISQSGTWHVQLSGTKTWLIRPNSKSPDWDSRADGVPDFSASPRAEPTEMGGQRLRITVEKGDLFVLNTKTWYHQTILETSPEWSTSIARDFLLPLPKLSSPCNVQTGEVVLEEDDIPEELAPASKDGNCVLAEISSEDHNNNDPDEPTIALVAVKAIKQGEPLVLHRDVHDDDDDDSDCDEETEPQEHTAAANPVNSCLIAHCNWQKRETVLSNDEIPFELPKSIDPNCEVVDDGESVLLRTIRPIASGEVFTVHSSMDGGCEEYNAAETIDPRLVADHDWQQNEAVLANDAIPFELPRSFDPNCELVDDGESVLVRTIRPIACGEVFTIHPCMEEDYDEVEVELGTGEVIRE